MENWTPSLFTAALCPQGEVYTALLAVLFFHMCSRNIFTFSKRVMRSHINLPSQTLATSTRVTDAAALSLRQGCSQTLSQPWWRSPALGRAVLRRSAGADCLVGRVLIPLFSGLSCENPTRQPGDVSHTSLLCRVNLIKRMNRCCW